MTYPVNSVANHVIEYAKSVGNHVNNLKLQKILYYLEARFLVEGKGSLFDEVIEKWQYGPVVPSVYYRFNHLGAEDITQIPVVFDFMSLLSDDPEIVSDKEPEDFEIFSSDELPLINDTIDQLIQYKPFVLVDETHKHPTWWKDEGRILDGVRNIPYDREGIKKDFIDNPDFKLWVKKHDQG